MNPIDERTAEGAPERSPFEVVALLASAGGVRAISTLVRHLPADFPAAVIVILHLGPGKNHLIESLALHSELPVQWATRYETFQPGRVYVCPPRQTLWVQPDRTCDLVSYDAVIQAKPMSAFLQSLAESYGSRALAVILTGMWKDGVEGVQMLKAAGGTVLVQSEESAVQPEMPRAAIETGIIDLVLPLQELGHVIPNVVAGGELPRSYSEIEAVSALFRGQDDTSARLREVAWERTAFGPVSRWPTSLTTTVRLMMAHSMAMALFWGPELRLLYNDAYRPMLGSSHPQAIGLPAHEVYRDIWPNLAPLYQQVTTSGQALHRDDQHWTLLRDGRIEDVYATSDYSPIRDEQGLVQGVLLTVIETTKHMLVERRAATLHSLAARGLRLHDQHEVCEQALQVLGQNPDDIPFALLYLVDDVRLTMGLGGATGTLTGTFAAPEVVRLSEGHPIWPLATVLEQGKALLLYDLSTRMRGISIGPEVKASSAAILLPLQPVADDHILGVLIIGLSARGIFDAPYREFLDLVAAQVAAGFAAARAAQHNTERLEALTALDRAKTDFLSNISHEFRTPLTLLLGPLEQVLKQQDQLPASVLDDLQLVQRNASQLYKLVNTLLDFSRIEAKRTMLNLEPTDLSALTQDLASLFRSAAEQAGLAFIVDCPPLPALIPVDREMWEKIVLNLLSNALKFTFSGSISLTLRPLPQHVELMVADTGVGIAEEEQPLLFQRFHRIAETRGRTQQGSGIGLALVQEYTRLHNGRVRVRSQVGKGTTFTIWLPSVQPARNGQRGLPAGVSPATVTAEAQRYADEAVRWVQEETNVPAASALLDADIVDEQTPLPVFVPHARVLVVEDHADMRTYLQRLLSGHWQVQLAANGKEALEQAHSSPPDLILADVMMPEMDGFALLRHVRVDEHLRTIPFLLMTARAGEEAAIEGLLAGADDYLIKPFSAREMLARISAQLELSRVRREGEMRLSLATEGAQLAVFEWDLLTDIVHVNARFRQLFEFGDDEEIIGTDFLDRRISATSRAWANEQLQAAFDPASDGRYTFEFETTRPSGAPAWVLTHGRVYFTGEGDQRRAVRVFGTGLDITERKRAEEAVLNNESRLRIACEAAELGVFEWDPSRDETSWEDDRMFEIFGRSREQGPLTAAMFMEEVVHPDDARRFQTALEASFTSGRLDYTGRFRRKDGALRWVMFIGKMEYTEDGTPLRMPGITADVTERKLAEAHEERRRIALESGRMGTWQLDCHSQRFWADAELLAMWGLETTEEPLPLSAYTALMAPEDAARWNALATGSHAPGESSSGDISIISGPAAGRTIFYRASFSREMPWILNGVSFDVTDQRRAEEALRKNEERQTFLLSLSDAVRHLQNPLDIQKTAMKLLAEKLDVERTGYYIMDDDEDSFTVTARYDRSTISLPERGRLSTFDPTLIDEYRSGKTVTLCDSEKLESESLQEAYRKVAIRSWAVVPLVKEGRLITAIGIQCAIARHWTDTELQILNDVAERTWDAVERAKAEEALRKSEQLLAQELNDAKQLQNFSNEVIHLNDPNKIYKMILDTAMKLMRSDLTSFQLYDPRSETLSLVAHKNFHPRSAEFWKTVAAGSGSVCGEALHTKSRIVISDIETESFARNELKIFRLSGIRAVQSTPLISSHGKMIGMLNTQWKTPRKFSKNDFRFFDMLARQVADLIEKKEAEEALRKSEEKYRVLFDSIDEGLTVTELVRDSEGRPVDLIYRECNQAFERLSGLSKEVMNRRVTEVLPHYDPEWFVQYARIAETGVPERSEEYLPDLDRYIRRFMSRIGGPGSPFCAVVFDDTTELKRRELQQEFLLQLSDTLRTETGTESLTVEQACQRALAVLAEHPADIPFALLYLLTDDGQQAHLVGTIGIAQQAFSGPKQLLFTLQEETTPGPLAQVNRTRQALLVEDLHLLLGDASFLIEEQSLQSAYILPITHPTQPYLAGLLVVGITPYHAFDDSSRDFLHLIATQIAAALVNAQAYEEASARAEYLAALDRAKTSFFSNISHEFRTPLTLLLGPLEDLLSGSQDALALPSSVHEQLSLVHRNALRLLKLVNTLLDFSRIEAGRIQANYAPTDLAALTRELASVFRPAIERAGLQLRVDCPPLPEPIYVDRDMWEKIVLNLLSNALKFTFEGEIAVSLHQRDGQVELVVRDTGTGIEASELPHLFERFHRVQGARARTHEGSGIGLALVSDLVGLHGGSISAISTLGQGSSFTVCIPTGSAHLPAEQVRTAASSPGSSRTRAAYVEEVFSWLSGSDDISQTSKGPSPSEVERGQGEGTGEREESTREAHILLAEDNADMRDYLAFLLRNAGYSVEAVENGSAALAALQWRVPDLLLSDVMMPELDGLHLLKRVRADPRTQRLPVILLSARAGEEAAIEGLSLLTDDYLMKPFSTREMLARVRTNVELGHMRERAVREAQQHVARLEGLYEALLAVHSTLSPQVVFDLISQEARDLLGASYALASYTSDQDQAQSLVSVSPNASESVPFTVFAASTSVEAHDQHHVKSLLEPLRERYAHLQRLPLSSPYWLEAPLLQRDGSEIGSVQVVNKTRGTFGEEDRLVLLQLVQMTSMAVENARLYQTAQDTIASQQEDDDFTHLLAFSVTQHVQALLSAFASYLNASQAAFDRVRAHAQGSNLDYVLQPHEEMIQNLSGQLEQARHVLTRMQDYSLAQRGLLQLACRDDADLVPLARAVVANEQARNPHYLFMVAADEESLLACYDPVLVKQVLSTLLSYVTSRSPSEKVISVRLSFATLQEAKLVSVRYEEAESRTQEHDDPFDAQDWMKSEPDLQNLELALDLHLSAAIIRLHGGRIWSEQHGTNQHLNFLLPRSPKEESAKPHESSI